MIPSHFNYSTLVVQAANGSSVTGHCSDTTQHLDAWSTCSSPASSVLFDGVIPTLTALDGDTWASQLMILQRPLIGSYSFSVYSSFANASWIRRVEVVMLNCPQWGTAVDSIRIEFQYPGSRSYRNSRNGFPSVISCDSLVKVCIPVDIHDSALTGIKLDFYTWDNDRDQFYKVHLAEVSFYEDASPCPPFTIIPGNLTPPQGSYNFCQGVNMWPSQLYCMHQIGSYCMHIPIIMCDNPQPRNSYYLQVDIVMSTYNYMYMHACKAAKMYHVNSIWGGPLPLSKYISFCVLIN